MFATADTVSGESGLRSRQAEFAKAFNLTFDEFSRIVRSCSLVEITVVLEVLRVKNHRSSFRANAHARIRRWLDEKLPGPPLMPSVVQALTPVYPVRWVLPT
jgi:hypothetical protein